MNTTNLHDLLPTDATFTAAVTDPATGTTPAKVSAVLATYNRCPFDPADGRLRDNPLTWALDSLRAQAGDTLAEIIVVDDGSSDHTPAVLEHYERSPGVTVRTHRLPEHRGAGAARNTAAALADQRWLLFGDDDCVFGPHVAAGAAQVMHRLREEDHSAAAVMLPFYYRALWPRDVCATADIGRLDPAGARFATRFHTWPTEYGNDPPRILGPAGLVAPLPVQLIGGTALIDADILHRTGGFVDLSDWASSYSDHLHLSADLTDAGGNLYHCPDPRLAAIHLKFGARGRYPLSTGDLDTTIPSCGRRLRELVALSCQPRQDTGCRISDQSFHGEMIGSFFAFFAGRSLTGAHAWALRTWDEFVTAGQPYSLAVATVPDLGDRIQAWRNGLARGAGTVSGDRLRPGCAPNRIQRVLDQACAASGQPPITHWSL